MGDSHGRVNQNYNGRTLPPFHKDNNSPVARGFVRNSFLSGLDPEEFFFHAMGGREGIIDTAIKTAESGYMQRKLIKALEDVMVKYDLTIRGYNNNIYQFIYGNNGFNPVYLVKNNLYLLKYNNSEISKNLLFSKGKFKKYKNYDIKFENKIKNNLIKLRDIIRNSYIKSPFKNKIILEIDFKIPFDIRDIIINNSKSSKKDLVDPKYVYELINKFF